MAVSFKKFLEFVDLEGDVSEEKITEIFGFFKNNEKVEKLKKEREKLKGLSSQKKAELDRALQDFKDGKKPTPKGALALKDLEDALGADDRKFLAKDDRAKNQTGRPAYESMNEGLNKMLDKYFDQEKMYNFEGDRGIRNLTKVLGVLDRSYHDIDTFLEDNSGAIEAIIEWVKRQRVPEWTETLASGSDDASLMSKKLPIVVDAYLDHHKMYSFEGRRGVKNISELVSDMGGYRDLDAFFSDNSGAIEAVLTWIADSNVPEWKSSMENEVGTDEDEEEEET